METAKKPEIKSITVTVKVPREGELIKKFNDNLPRITRQINNNKKKAKLSVQYFRNKYSHK